MTPEEWNLFIDLKEWITALVTIGITLALAPALGAAFHKYKNHLRLSLLSELLQSLTVLVYPVGLRIALDLAPLPPHYKVTVWLSAAVYIFFVWTMMSLARRSALLAIEWSSTRGPQSSAIFQHGFIPMLRNGATLVAVMVGGIMILKYFGYDVMSLVAALGVGSLAVGMAAKETLTNMISGFTLIIDQNLHVGDKINLGGSVGVVEEIGLRNTRLNMRDGNALIVPNTDLVNNRILNMTTQGLAGACGTRLRVPLSVPFEKVKKTAEAVFENTPFVVREKGVSVMLTHLEEGNQLISVGFWVNNSDEAEGAVSAFLVALTQASARDGIALVGPPPQCS